MQIDSHFSKEEAILAKPENNCPPDVLRDQVLLDVRYFNFEGVECQGQIVVHKDVADDVREVFEHIHRDKFPIRKAVPIVAYAWDDDASCSDDNSSGFNYRTIAGTDRLSNHALGYAFDINPVQNPYTRWKEGEVIYHTPQGAVYDATKPGTLHGGHPIVTFLKSRGWTWGGDWIYEGNVVDYQHFEKVPS